MRGRCQQQNLRRERWQKAAAPLKSSHPGQLLPRLGQRQRQAILLRIRAPWAVISWGLGEACLGTQVSGWQIGVRRHACSSCRSPAPAHLGLLVWARVRWVERGGASWNVCSCASSYHRQNTCLCNCLLTFTTASATCSWLQRHCTSGQPALNLCKHKQTFQHMVS